MIEVETVVGGFVAACLEPGCGRRTKLIRRQLAVTSAVCHHEDCPACKAPLFGPNRPDGLLRFDSTHCAWCGGRFHQDCLTPSKMSGDNLWCRLCNAEWELTNDVEPDRTVIGWMP